MIRSCTVFGLAAAFQVISGQILPDADDGPYGPYSADNPRQGPLVQPYQEKIPRHCWAPPPNVSPYECCPVPQIFTDDEMAACGIEKSSENRPPITDKVEDCSHGNCLMKNANLLDDAGNLNHIKLKAFIEVWAKANPDYEEAINIAMDKCVVEGGPPILHSNCEPDKIFLCMTSTILWNCKLREDIERCKVLQEHMDECRRYYEKPKDDEQKQ